ncbi:MAG: N-acetyl-alpha-D-glucosaminyl L-malate synthase BshA [Bdellovibrionota bacterium]
MTPPLRIGITCYPTFGGSGVIATEIGMAMARRGHKVHFISYDVPRRLDRFLENIYFHEVEVHDYPLFVHPPYPLSLASKMVEVVTYEKLDLLHVHYAVPHATSAYLAKQVLGNSPVKVITTLHGTDITLVGNDRSYLPIVRFSISQSDGVTTPSQYLKLATYDKLNLSTDVPIEVIPNFVDTDQFRPLFPGEPRNPSPISDHCLAGDKVLVHVSNFRPVKRIHDVVKAFDIVSKQIKSHLVLIGDGPERSRIERLVRDLGLEDQVCFLGKQENFVPILQLAHLFLLPSETESFGLAALEAMSCGVPVIATDVHGIPEVVQHGRTGFLSEVGDVEDMAQHAMQLLTNESLHQQFSRDAREAVLEKYSMPKLIDRYEQYYRDIIKQPAR